MSDLRDLYQEIILDHGKHPRNCRQLDDADRSAQGHNPLCGDRVTVYVRFDGDRIADVSFTGGGCAISTASASMMTQALRGRTVDEAREIFRTFHNVVTGKGDPLDVPESMDKLVALAGVREFPVRIKCATLAWHTLSDAIEDRGEVASTE